MDRQVVRKPDGRSVIFYGFSASVCVEPRPAAPAAEADPPPAAGITEQPPPAAELRWNPVLREWVATAALRQDRTFFPPPDYCPLCPTSEGSYATEIPRPDYEIVVFESRFPAFTPQSAGSSPEGDDLYAVAPARGVCEVVVYSPQHDATLTQLPESELRNLIAVWADRCAELGALPYVEYVYVFENKGREIGVTLQHPHGQIYALPFVPPIPRAPAAASSATSWSASASALKRRRAAAITPREWWPRTTASWRSSRSSPGGPTRHMSTRGAISDRWSI